MRRGPSETKTDRRIRGDKGRELVSLGKISSRSLRLMKLIQKNGHRMKDLRKREEDRVTLT